MMHCKYFYIQGKLVGIAGRFGCGKTTLVKALLGEVRTSQTGSYLKFLCSSRGGTMT